MVPGRYQTGLTYDPSMRSGTYRGGAVQRNSLADAYADVPRSASFAPALSRGGAMMAPPAPAAPTLAGGTGALSGAPPPYSQGGAGESAQGGYGGPGPTGAPSTGDLGRDAMNAAQALGAPAASMAFGGPMGIAGFGIGAMTSGLAAAFGAPQTAAGIARSLGLPGVAPSPYSYSAADGDFGGPKGTETAYGMSSTPPHTPALADFDFGTLGPAPAKDDIGLDATAENTGKDFGGSTAGGDVAGTSNENASPGDGTGQGEDGGAKHEGGMIEPGDGEETGAEYGGQREVELRALEGEFVVRPEAVRMYGRNFLHAINQGQMPVNALAGAMGGGRQMQSANNLLQMMHR